MPLAPRLLGALMALAEERRISAVIAANQPPITVLALPDEGAAVVLFERGELAGAELQAALDRLLDGQAGGILHLVLCGGDARDLPVLREADRKAPDPKRLGMYQLEDSGRLVFVGGRRQPLLPEASKRLANVEQLSPAEVDARAQRAHQAHLEATAFAQALQQRPQPATRVLAAACLGYFLLSAYWGGGDLNGIDDEALLAMGANARYLSLEQLQVWRLLSHAFLHAGFIHIVVNLVGLWSFGRFLEGVLGWHRYLLVYGLSALAGGLASALLMPDPAFSVGASGALFGLLGAGLGLTTGRQKVLPAAVVARLRPPLHRVLVLNVIISVLPLFVPQMPRIDLFAHGGGGLAGFLLVASGALTRGLAPLTIAGPAAGESRETTLFRVTALVMAACLALSVGIALATGQPWSLGDARLALAPAL